MQGMFQDYSRTNSGFFLGLPFVAPPTGDLRWRPPAPVEAWDGADLDLAECKKMLSDFIEEKPDLWNEDIGVL